jgi:hypothetical protein
VGEGVDDVKIDEAAGLGLDLDLCLGWRSCLDLVRDLGSRHVRELLAHRLVGQIENDYPGIVDLWSRSVHRSATDSEAEPGQIAGEVEMAQHFAELGRVDCWS